MRTVNVEPRPGRRPRRTSWYAAGLLALNAAGSGLAATAVAASPAVPGPAVAGARHAFDNALIARTALGYVGRWGGQACQDSRHDASGQCKQFVNCVVALASGGRVYPVDPSGDYQDSYLDVGGVEVTADAAVVGDIIQVGEHDADVVLHTAIITGRGRSGSFTVVDANWVGAPATPELVGVHPYTPPADARFWRLGTVRSVPAASAGKTAGQQRATGDGQLDGTPSKSVAAPAAPALSTTADVGMTAGTISLTVAAAGGPSPSTVAVRLYVDDHPYATVPAVGGAATIALDTIALPDGPHHVAAQAITAAGMISPLSAPLPFTVINTRLAVVAKVPTTPLLAGLVPVAVATNVTDPLASVAWSVDGRTVPTPPAEHGAGWELDTSALTPGAHQISVAATDSRGRAATSAPVTVTVTGAATGVRIALDVAGTGLSDLIGVDPSGRLLRYPNLGDGRFALPVALSPDHSFADVRALAGGHYTTTDSAAQLVMLSADHSARLATFDTTGHLTGGTPIAGVAWDRYVRLVSVTFSSAEPDQLLGFTADGHADLITVASDGRTATAAPTTAATTGTTATTTTATATATTTALAVDLAGSGTDTPITVDTTGTAAAPVAGRFTADAGPQVLVTLADGSTLIKSVTGAVIVAAGVADAKAAGTKAAGTKAANTTAGATATTAARPPQPVAFGQTPVPTTANNPAGVSRADPDSARIF